ncbi:MAG TPA: hypothetical protein VEC14_04715 [Reyranellaceae bacterium]|nr:hypothetical protein [Reyranellaceae bacterium]
MAKSLIDQLADAVVDLKNRVMGLERRAERAVGLRKRSVKRSAAARKGRAKRAVRKVKARARGKMRKAPVRRVKGVLGV